MLHKLENTRRLNWFSPDEVSALPQHRSRRLFQKPWFIVPERLTNMEIESRDKNEDIKAVASNIALRVVQSTTNLYCPFCAEVYYYEFRLKEHLVALHAAELEKYSKNAAHSTESDVQQSFSESDTNFCTLCGAFFIHAALIPKHIVDQHGEMFLRMWQQQNNPPNENQTDTSVLFAACSPGLSDIFDKITTNEEETLPTDQPKTPLKGILKKPSSTSKQKIICSPSSASVRRNRNACCVKRSVSVRRELRFDFPIESADSDEPDVVDAPHETSLTKSKRSPNRKPKNRSPFNFKKFLFPSCKAQRKKPTDNIITSTPINLLDDIENDDNSMLIGLNNNKNWRATIRRQKHKPLFSYLERFQCAHCSRTWDNNAELLAHLKHAHKEFRLWFQPNYRCGECRAKFFCNRFLVRHCAIRHTRSTPLRHLR